MKIHYKIIKTHPIDSQIIVRYFTDIVNEQYLSIETDEHGETVRSRGDYVIDIPLNSLESIEKIIEKNCPHQALRIEEKKIQTLAGKEHKEIITNISKIEGLSIGSINTLDFPEKTEEEILTDKLKRVDADADFLTFSLYGTRENLYRDAYKAAMTFKNSGYVGDVPQYIKGNMKCCPDLTKESATDIIIKNHEYSEKIFIDINTNRFITKTSIRDGKEKALGVWEKFVNKTKTKIG